MFYNLNIARARAFVCARYIVGVQERVQTKIHAKYELRESKLLKRFIARMSGTCNINKRSAESFLPVPRIPPPLAQHRKPSLPLLPPPLPTSHRGSLLTSSPPSCLPAPPPPTAPPSSSIEGLLLPPSPPIFSPHPLGKSSSEIGLTVGGRDERNKSCDGYCGKLFICVGGFGSGAGGRGQEVGGSGQRAGGQRGMDPGPECY